MSCHVLSCHVLSCPVMSYLAFAPGHPLQERNRCEEAGASVLMHTVIYGDALIDELGSVVIRDLKKGAGVEIEGGWEREGEGGEGKRE
jgi:hypothetical protein